MGPGSIIHLWCAEVTYWLWGLCTENQPFQISKCRECENTLPESINQWGGCGSRIWGTTYLPCALYWRDVKCSQDWHRIITALKWSLILKLTRGFWYLTKEMQRQEEAEVAGGVWPLLSPAVQVQNEEGWSTPELQRSLLVSRTPSLLGSCSL